MERDNRPTVIELKMGKHENRHSPAIKAVSQTAREVLGSSDNGRMIIFNEGSDVTTAYRNKIIKYADQGLSASESFLRAIFATHRMEPSEDELEDERKARRKSPDFVYASWYAIDRLQTDYPNRVGVDIESASYKDIRTGARRSKRRDAVMDEFGDLVTEGRFTEALPFFQEAVSSFASEVTERDPRIAAAVIRASKQTDVIAVVGSLGAAHSGVVHRLRKEGYNAHSSFPEAEKGVYVFGPMITAIRQAVFFPNHAYTQEEWLRIMIGESLYMGSGVLKARYTHPRNIFEAGYYFFKRKGSLAMKSDKFLIEMIWKLLRGFTIDDIITLQKHITRDGFDKTIEKLFKK